MGWFFAAYPGDAVKPTGLTTVELTGELSRSEDFIRELGAI
jgi:hypothetical protein